MNWIILEFLNKVYQTPILLSLYKLFKYFYGQITQTTEINRILYKPVRPYRLYRLDNAIQYSKELVKENYQLKQPQCDLDSVKISIIQKKFLDACLHDALNDALVSLYATYQLLNTINDSVSEKYNVDNKEHEDKLLQLWNKMKPNTPLESRISKQWVDIGFQGNDPATDFRGMGIQGLDDLLYFVDHYPDQVQSILQHANHPQQWYPFAIVGINITKFAYQLLESKKLQLYLFEYGTDDFQELYCFLFYNFDQSWRFSVMEFEEKFKEFQFIIEKELIQQKIKPFSMNSRKIIYKYTK